MSKQRRTPIQETINYIDTVFPAKQKDVNAIWDIRNFLLTQLEAEKKCLQQAYMCGEGDAKFPVENRLKENLSFESYYKDTYRSPFTLKKD